MKGMILLFLLVLAISINNYTKIHASKHEFLSQEFSTFTSAICENKSDVVYCKDEFFMNCNGNISRATDVAECNGFKFDAPKITGFATFDKQWKDPRN